MSKTNKKILIAILAVIIVTAAVLCSVMLLNGGKKADSDGWSFENHTLTVTCDSMESWEEEIPWEDLKPEIKAVEIENNVKDICEKAFSDCTELESVSIGHSVKSIGKAAFKNCSKLREITIPESVEMVEVHAFSECRNLVIKLESTDIPAGFAENWCDSDTKVEFAQSAAGEADEKSKELNYETENVTLSEYGTRSFEKITFTGDFSGIDKINEFFENEYNDFASDNAAHDAYAIEWEKSGKSVKEFKDILSVTDVWNNDEFLSVVYSFDWFEGGVNNYGNKCYVFNLETGDKLKIREMFPDMTETQVQEVLKSYSYSALMHYGKNEQGTEINNAAAEFVVKYYDELVFYLDGSNLYVVFNQYDIDCGAAGCYSLTVPLSAFNG